MWHDGGWMWGGMLVFWALLALLVYLAVSSRGDRDLTGAPPSAAELLDQRYARGELTSDDYRERRDTLEHGRGTAPDVPTNVDERR